MEEKRNVIEIDVTSPSTRPREEFESLFDQTGKIIDLIKERLRDIDLIKVENLSERKEFEKYASSDSIVIDGRRGTGKTTHLLTLKEKLRKELPNVFCLNVIDPANLSDDIDILQVFLAELCKTLQEQLESEDPLKPSAINNSSRFYDKRYLFEEISSLIHEISLILRKFSRLNKSDLIENEHEAMFMNHEMLNLPFKVHLLAKKVCNFFGVDAVIVPIDDIDMNLKQTHRVLTFIKDFFSTPYLIPVVALDTSQALAVIKKRKHEFFGLKVNDSPLELDDSLEFLRKLPAEWLQKILPPSRRIILPDILQIYENYIKDKRNRNKKIYFNYEVNGRRIKIEFSEAVHLFLALVYEWNYIPGFKDGVPYQVRNVLEGKSIRDFVNDVRALLQGIVHSDSENWKELDKETFEVTYDMSYLKARYKPYAVYEEVGKFDSVRWFWKSLQKVFEKRYKKGEEIKDIVREVIKVASEDNKIVSRLEKTFYRLIMQEFYLEEITIRLKKINIQTFGIEYFPPEGEQIFVKKKENVKGFRELIARTVLPAYIFYFLLREKMIFAENFNWGEFYPLYSSSSEEELKSFYDRLSIWTILYGNSKLPFYIYLGREDELENNSGLFRWIGVEEKRPFGGLFKENLIFHPHPVFSAFYGVYFNPFLYVFKAYGRRPDRVEISPERSSGISFSREVTKQFAANIVLGLKHFNSQLEVMVKVYGHSSDFESKFDTFRVRTSMLLQNFIGHLERAKGGKYTELYSGNQTVPRLYYMEIKNRIDNFFASQDRKWQDKLMVNFVEHLIVEELPQIESLSGKLDKELQVRDLSELEKRKGIIDRLIFDLISQLRKLQKHLELIGKEDIGEFVLFSMARGISRAVVEILGTYPVHFLHQRVNFYKRIRKRVGKLSTDFYCFHGFRPVYEIQFPKLSSFQFAQTLKNINQKLPEGKDKIMDETKDFIKWLFFSAEYLLNYSVETIIEVDRESGRESMVLLNVSDGNFPLSKEENKIIETVKELDEILNNLQKDTLETLKKFSQKIYKFEEKRKRIAGIAVSYLMFKAIEEVKKKLSMGDDLLEFIECLVREIESFKKDADKKFSSLIVAILTQIRLEEIKEEQEETDLLDENLFLYI